MGAITQNKVETRMNNRIKEILNNYIGEKEMYETINEFFSFLPETLINELDTEEIIKVVTPDNIIAFDVEWINDNGELNKNKGYRVQFSNANGVYKGGLRFHSSVNLSIIKMLAFEQTFKNILTGQPMGGAKGGSDFDPKGKSEAEIIRFSKKFMKKLQPYIGTDVDIPAGDIGVGHREIRAMYEEYVHITGRDDGVLTGKPLDLGGSLGRKEATGYGLCYIGSKCLKDELNTTFKDKRTIISGSGNVALYAAKKVVELGGVVVAMSDSNNAIFNENGLDINHIIDIKENKRCRIREYLKEYPGTKLLDSYEIWKTPCDIALPCATQFEINLEAAKELVKNGVILVAEGSNMATEAEAAKYLIENTLYLPGKAANAGGVCVSYFEMQQNKNNEKWSLEEVDKKLKEVMENIFENISDAAKEYENRHNYLMGANVYSLKTLLKKK